MSETANLNPEPIKNWTDYANCMGLDPNLFFPQTNGGVYAAQKVCELCIVKVECLDSALTNHIDHGVWGGTSERERRRIASRSRRTQS